jgi:hypothetical protein
MRTQRPVAALVQEDHVRWRIDLNDLRAVREGLGTELLNAFCRSMVAAERLASLVDVSYLSRMNYRDGADESGRHVVALAVCGHRLLSDAIHAIRLLLARAAATGVLDRSSRQWLDLETCADQWQLDRVYALLAEDAARDEEATIGKGLAALEARVETVLCRGRGAIFQQCSGELGPRAWAAGAEVDKDDAEYFITMLSRHRSLPTMIQRLFVLTMEAKGLGLEEPRDALLAADGRVV